ncbi:MAG: type II toxin-antitoxin system VapC family toxin [Nanoarchaeota archaeon]
MTYLDANVFIFAACDQSPLGEAARQIIRQVQSGKCRASTSVLSYDEVVWGTRKKLNKEAGFLAGEFLLSLPHLAMKDVKRETITEAHHLIKHFNVKPRDAIHAATMRLENEQVLVSEDPDFDIISGIKRLSLLEFARQGR